MALAELGVRPDPIQDGQIIFDTVVSGGKSIYWSGGVEPLEGAQLVEVGRSEEANRMVVSQTYEGPMQGSGLFRLDFLIYDFFGMDLQGKTDSMLATMELPTKIVLPFLVMIASSFFMGRNSTEALDRYYSKMKTPVRPDPEEDKKALEQALLDKDAHESKKWIPGSDLEIEKPKMLDIFGFLGTFAMCFLIIGLAIWIARIGS